METAKLYIGNLPFTVSNDDVKALFGEAGEVEDVRLITDRETGRSKGYAFVTFVTENGATAALEKFNGYEYQGRALRVDRARPSTGGGGGGRGDRGDRGGQRRNNSGAGRERY
ncbi:MAG: glycine-rich RNA-binding protein [Gammaproteobacteria bacterium]|nr:glycine-rich RNA-binding protein [Gammaproteobacteria bacterium]